MGWRMVAVAFFVDFVAVAFFFYSYGIFFKDIAARSSVVRTSACHWG
ncbi:MAG: hypothetical protein QGI55_00545 [Pseudomonadales bacterium]|nr:hypothetical protein [Pseudomonadales bacterium]